MSQAVKDLLRGGLAPSEVGVITPYASQVRAVRAHLRSDLPRSVPAVRELSPVEVSSVDGFQGREKEVL